MYSYDIRMTLMCHSYVPRIYSYIIHMPLVCIKVLKPPKSIKAVPVNTYESKAPKNFKVKTLWLTPGKKPTPSRILFILNKTAYQP